MYMQARRIAKLFFIPTISISATLFCQNSIVRSVTLSRGGLENHDFLTNAHVVVTTKLGSRSIWLSPNEWIDQSHSVGYKNLQPSRIPTKKIGTVWCFLPKKQPQGKLPQPRFASPYLVHFRKNIWWMWNKVCRNSGKERTPAPRVLTHLSTYE